MSRGQIGFRGHACDGTYSVVNDIRNQFIIGTKKIVIFVIRKLVLDFSIRFFNFQKNNSNSTPILGSEWNGLILNEWGSVNDFAFS